MQWFNKRKSRPLPLALEPPQPVQLEPLIITPFEQVVAKLKIPNNLKSELSAAFKRECERQALRALTLEEVHRAQGARDAFEKFLNLAGEVKT
jgi:hypothetical protein